MRPKKSIQKGLILGSLASMLILSLCLSITSYLLISSALYDRHKASLTDVLTYVEHRADADDLRACIESETPSEAYAQLQLLLNGMVDDFRLEYLYVVIPEPASKLMYNVVSATNAKELAAGEQDLALMQPLEAYSYLTLQRYRSYWDEEQVQFFEETSDYGKFYTACKPLRDSKGDTVALLCADVSVDALHQRINHYVLQNVSLTLVIGFAFACFLLRWLRKNVTGPVLELEKAARRFAEKSHSVNDPRQLRFELPEIRTDNELQSLADAVFKMSTDLKTGVERLISSEARAASAESKAEDMTRLAYQDPLTHVKSKTAYESKAAELTSEIEAGTARFAMLMADMNELKEINDQYGHDCGDKYLVGACMLICQVYKHSPVFRVGGDEFVVVLQGTDYDNRDALLAELREKLQQTCREPGREPWERFSAAAGMAVYGGAEGETVEQVLDLADERMYAEKARMKAEGLH